MSTFIDNNERVRCLNEIKDLSFTHIRSIVSGYVLKYKLNIILHTNLNYFQNILILD